MARLIQNPAEMLPQVLPHSLFEPRVALRSGREVSVGTRDAHQAASTPALELIRVDALEDLLQLAILGSLRAGAGAQ